MAGGLKEVVDQAADRLQKKRKAGEMPTLPFASPTAAHRASADRQLPASKSLAAVKAAWGSPVSPQGKEQTGDDPTSPVVRYFITALPWTSCLQSHYHCT